jgi:septal ring factor EnvC (AmiA/AmiB activator)
LCRYFFKHKNNFQQKMEDTTTTGKSLAAFPLLAVVLGSEVDAQAEFGPLTDIIETSLKASADASATLSDQLTAEQTAHQATIALHNATKANLANVEANLANANTKLTASQARTAELEAFFANQANAGTEAAAQAGDLGANQGTPKAKSVAEMFPKTAQKLGLKAD